jgi:RTX calcium-binding nonapeptide repeat (4 copies)
MRAHTKKKHRMGKRFAVVIGAAAVGVMALGAQTVIANNVIERPNGHKVPYRAMGEVSSNVSLDVFAVPFDPQGVVTYAFGGETRAQAEIGRVRFVQKGPSGGGGGGAACSEYRTVTLFRVEPNGTSTRVASVQTGQGTTSANGPRLTRGGFALERPLGEITGYYYAEVAPATTRKLGRQNLYKVRGAYYRALTCLPARSPTIFAEVPAATPPSHAPPTCNGKPATILGTDGSDDLSGTQGPDVIVGLGGGDFINGNRGNDVICGGKGADYLDGGHGEDTLLGQAGRDALIGGDGKDRCEGGKGKDWAAGSGPGQPDCQVKKSIEESGDLPLRFH